MERLLIVILIVHWICDFLFQTRSMGRNKSSSLIWLFAHGIAYTIGMLAILCIFEFFGPTYGFENVIPYVLVNGILHTLTDFFTSRATTYCYTHKINDLEHMDLWEYGYWCMIGFDQLIHTMTLLFTIRMILMR